MGAENAFGMENDMPDEKNNGEMHSEEGSLNDLIASAIEKKKEAPKKEPQPAPVKEMTLQESIAQAKYNKQNGIKPAPRKEQTSEDDMSIEDMVANAMHKKSGKAQYDDDDSFEEEPDEEKSFWQKAKDFFIRNKLKFIVAGMILVVIALIVLLVFILFFNHYYKRIEREDASIVTGTINSVGESDTVSNVDEYEDYLKDQLKDYADIMASKEVYNVLLVGEDLRDTAEGGRGNTDVMLLVSVNRETKKIVLTSFMRDIYIYIPGYWSDKLNSAYSKGGASLLKDTIERNFGVKIDNYVIVNFYTFIQIVDILGGIEADVTQVMVDEMRNPMMEQNMYLGNPSTQDLLSTAGHYNLNGNQALGYARIRYNVGDDYGRTARQREVIQKMIEKSRDMDLGQMKDILDKVTEGDNVRWDLSKEDVLSLLTNAVDYYRNYEIQQIQVPASGTFTTQTIRTMDCLCPDFAANTEILQMAIYGKTFVNPDQTSQYVFVDPPTYTDPPVYDTTAEPPQVEDTTTPEPTTTEYVPPTETETETDVSTDDTSAEPPPETTTTAPVDPQPPDSTTPPQPPPPVETTGQQEAPAA